MKHIEKIFAIGMLLFAIGFNLWLYRLEPTAKIDPNDNTFQFALVDRTNQIWDFAQQRCANEKLKMKTVKLSTVEQFFSPLRHFTFCSLQFTLLLDHWVPNWAEGYNLPFYYSHIPQILIVSSYRFLQLFTFHFSLFTFYHLVIYLLLSFFPISIFLALQVLRVSPITAGVGALLATHLSTDGLYGLDPSSFLWRGYGLSSQLFAMIFLPLAIAYSYRFFNDNGVRGKKNFKELKIRLKAFYKNHSVTNFHLARHEKYSNDQKGVDRVSLKNYFPEQSDLATRENSSSDSFAPAVFFLVATTAGHLGIGIIALLSLPVLALAKPIMLLLQSDNLSHIFEATKNQLTKLLLLLGVTFFFLSYWIVPILLNNNYHNISFWDPIWKFDSYGWNETMTRLFNGDLFDFGRLPILTFLVFIGFFATLFRNEITSLTGLAGLSSLALLFPFWLLLYFGRTTWGPLIDLIPGMKEFHLSRFLVGIHVAGLFLAPIGIHWIASHIITIFRHCEPLAKQSLKILYDRLPRLRQLADPRNDTTVKAFIPILAYIFIGLILLPPVYKQTIEYVALNNRLIKQANENFMKVKPDVDELFRTLLPLKGNGRVFAGRGGSWGKDFLVAETPYYMHLSTYGINTVLWLPETWSLNSDTEQYFSEDQVKDYDLYNIKYVVAPPKQKLQPFWRLIRDNPSWKLYEVNTSGYFAAGIRPAIVAVDKESFANVVRLWIQSDYPKRGLFPELTFDKDYPKNTGLPNFKMIDEANYLVPDGSTHSLFNEPPMYLPPNWKLSNNQINQLSNQPIDNRFEILSQNNNSDMIFSAKVKVEKDCLECILVLKQTSHPNWQVTIDGKRAERLNVFPFYNAVKISEDLSAQAGTHEVVFSYKPSTIKLLLLILELLAIGLLLIKGIARFKRFSF